jgi:hypothetical protein
MAGAGFGIIYQKQQEGNSKTAEAVRALSSRAVPSIAAYGQVLDISGRNITLSYSDESLTFPVIDGADIISVTNSNASGSGVTASAAQKKVDFSSIKKGDTLSVNIKLLADGSLEGRSVIIVSSK